MGTVTSFGGLPLSTFLPHFPYGFFPSRGYDQFSHTLAFKVEIGENKNYPDYSILRCLDSHSESLLRGLQASAHQPRHTKASVARIVRSQDSQDVAGFHGYLGAWSQQNRGPDPAARPDGSAGTRKMWRHLNCHHCLEQIPSTTILNWSFLNSPACRNLV